MKKVHKQQGWPQPGQDCQEKAVCGQKCGGASQVVDWGWIYCIKSHHRRILDMGFKCHIPPVDPLLNNKRVIPGLKKIRTGLLLSSPTSSFLMRAYLIWYPRSQSLEEEWRGTQSKMLEVQCEVSTVCVDLGSHVICWCWSTVLYQVQSQRNRLPGHFRGLHVSFSRQALWKYWLPFPAGLGTAKSTKTWFNDHSITVLDWPANSPDLNPRESTGALPKRWETWDRTMQKGWRPLLKHHGLP